MDHVAKQIRDLQHVLDENRRKLDCINERKKKTEEHTEKCVKEISRREILHKDYDKIIDDLQKLGQLLEQERCFKEQLSDQSEEDRRLWKDLKDRQESVAIKTQSVTSEIEDVTRQLEEAREYYDNATAQSSRPGPSTKTKRNRTKLQ